MTSRIFAVVLLCSAYWAGVATPLRSQEEIGRAARDLILTLDGFDRFDEDSQSRTRSCIQRLLHAGMAAPILRRSFDRWLGQLDLAVETDQRRFVESCEHSAANAEEEARLERLAEEQAELEQLKNEIGAEAFSLRGIESLWVLVEDLPEGASGIGLTTAQLRTDIELMLRHAGMKLDLSAEEFLYLRADVRHARQQGAVRFSLDLGFKQHGIFDRGFEGHAQTWGLSRLGGGGDSGAERAIREVAREMIDKFLSDYSKANSKN